MNKTTTDTPESVVLAKKLWMWIIVVEVVHQILRAAAMLADPTELKQQARQQSPQITEALLSLVTTTAVILGLVFSLLVLGLVAWAAVTFKRTVLMFVGVYLAIRTPMVFIEPTTGWLFAADGVAQIIVGVMAVLAIIFGARKDSVEWTPNSDKT